MLFLVRIVFEAMAKGIVVRMAILFFLVPLWFTPFTVEALEMSKQSLFVGLVCLGALAMMVAALSRGEIAARGKLWVVAPLIFVLGVTVVSAFGSIAGFESWFGYGGQEYASVVTTLCGVLLFAELLMAADVSVTRTAIWALLISGVLTSSVTILSLFGIHVLPFAFTQVSGFSTIGNINTLTAWLVPVVLLGLGWTSVDRTRGYVLYVLIGLLGFSALLLLIIIDFWALWVGLLIGAVALAVTMTRSGSSKTVAGVAAILIAIAVLFLLIKTPVRVQIPLIVSPSIGTSWEIAEQALAGDPLRLLLGSGPGSYDLVYAKYRPQNVNESVFWNMRFDRAQIHPITLLTTLGVLGLLAWGLLWIVLAVTGVVGMANNRTGEECRISGVLFAAWLSLMALQIVSASNMSLTVLFWGMSGLLVAHALPVRTVAFAGRPRVQLLAYATAGILFLGVVLVLVQVVQRYRAEVQFTRAVRLNFHNAHIDEVVGHMESAVHADSRNSVYQRNLALAYIAKTSAVLDAAAVDGQVSEDERRAAAAFADLAVAAATRATQLGTRDALNWSTAGLIYRQLMPLSQNAHDYAAAMYVEAMELEPKNPKYPTELGKVYLTVVDRVRAFLDAGDVDPVTLNELVALETENLSAAVKLFERSIAYKSDYAPAHYYLAAAYERQGQLPKAAEALLQLTEAQPRDIGLGFQLGIMYLKLENIAAAEAEFERILALYPDYSNALWYLAAIRSNAGDIEGALALLRRVERLNLGNAMVADSIRNLEAGQVTPEVPEPINDQDASTFSEDAL